MMANYSNLGSKRFIAIYLLFCHVFIVLGSIDPYATLGVSSSASQKEIKKSYKQLAREWHPDKNRDPGAGDRFIEIQHAYEILSDENRRAHYDRYGSEDENEGFGQRGNNNMFRGFQFPGGSSYSFKFSSGGGQRSQASRVTLRNYQTQILPGSYSKPFLLLMTGEWCFSCMRVESVWDQIQSDLEQAGLGTGTVSEDYDYNLVRQIGIYRKPAIVVIIQESVYKFGGNEISTEHLKKFVADLLPSHFITRVNDSNRQKFLSQFASTNRPSVLLFTRRSTPSALYKLLAFKFHRKINFGFVQTTDSQSKDTVSEFDIQRNQRELLIFKENVESPAEELEISNVQTDELSAFLSSNQYLYAPRLSSQTLYEELCPETPYSHSKSYCVILCLKQSQELSQTHESFIQVAMAMSSPLSDKYKVRFAYLVEEKQAEFTRKLNPLEPAMGTMSVVVLWRIDGKRAYLGWFPEGWHRDEPDADKKNLAEFMANIQWSKAKELPELNDEFAPNIFTRLFHSLRNKLKGWFQSIWDLFAYGSFNELSLIMAVGLIYLFCLVLVFFGLIVPPKPGEVQTEQRNPNEGEGQREGSRQQREGDVRLRRTPGNSNNSGQRYDRSIIHLKCLNSSTYDDLVRNPQKNRILLVLLVTDETNSALSSLFQTEVYDHAAEDKVLSFCYLNLNSYLGWCNELLAEDCSANQLAGSVLAIRPAKNYYIVFIPRCMDDADEGDNLFELQEEKHLLKFSLDGLNIWLDQLLDGGLIKTTVEEWPEMKDDNL